ncbi:MAG: sigma-70 family RNA polymerase sigma factor [Bacteroidota bacterium]
MNRLSDLQIRQGIQAGGQAAESAVAALYRQERERCLAFLQKQGANTEEAKDLFQEAVISVFENIRAERFRGESKLGNYLLSVARFLWLNRVKRSAIADRYEQSLEAPQDHPGPLPHLLAKEEQRQIGALFEQLGEQCAEVLQRSLYWEDTMEELAQRLGYANAQIARNKKYRCLERLRKMITQGGKQYAWLQDIGRLNEQYRHG